MKYDDVDGESAIIVVTRTFLCLAWKREIQDTPRVKKMGFMNESIRKEEEMHWSKNHFTKLEDVVKNVCPCCTKKKYYYKSLCTLKKKH